MFVGRLNKNKKISLAIKAIKIINSEKERLNFLIIGDGPELDVINKEIINHENIKRTQSIYDEFVLSKYLYFSDLLISPGNVGLNAIHSLTYGTPVCTHNDIAYQMPEFQALNENNAIFFKKDDVNSLVNSLDNWLNHNENFTDKNLVRRTIIERYNPKNQKHILKKILFKE